MRSGGRAASEPALRRIHKTRIIGRLLLMTLVVRREQVYRKYVTIF